MRKFAQFEIFALFFHTKGTYEATFLTLSICRKFLNEQNGVRFTFKVCFDMTKVVKGSHLVKSKVAFLKNTKNAAGICPFFHVCFQQILKKTKISKI